MPSSTPHTVCQPMATGTNLSKTATSALAIVVATRCGPLAAVTVGHKWATAGHSGAQQGRNLILN